MFVTAHCEFHSLIFLFISETGEAFFNKTTENIKCAIFFSSMRFIFHCCCHCEINMLAFSPCMRSKFLYATNS